MLKKALVAIIAATTLLTSCKTKPALTKGPSNGHITASAGSAKEAFLNGQHARSMGKRELERAIKTWRESRSYYRGNREYRDCSYDTNFGKERCTYYKERDGGWVEAE